MVVLNAGIGERGDFLDSKPESQIWQKTLDVDLRAVLVGMRIAGQMMRDLGRGGRILSVASAAGGGGGGGWWGDGATEVKRCLERRGGRSGGRILSVPSAAGRGEGGSGWRGGRGGRGWISSRWG